jgi:hypothetical protein
LNLRTVQVDGHIEACPPARRAGNQRERLALDLQRHVGRVPLAIFQEQVFLGMEAEQYGRLELPVSELLVKKIG